MQCYYYNVNKYAIGMLYMYNWYVDVARVKRDTFQMKSIFPNLS